MGKLSRHSTKWKMKIIKQHDLMISISVKKQYVLMGIYIYIRKAKRNTIYQNVNFTPLRITSANELYFLLSSVLPTTNVWITAIGGLPGRINSLFHPIFCLFRQSGKGPFSKTEYSGFLALSMFSYTWSINKSSSSTFKIYQKPMTSYYLHSFYHPHPSHHHFLVYTSLLNSPGYPYVPPLHRNPQWLLISFRRKPKYLLETSSLYDLCHELPGTLPLQDHWLCS